MRSQHTVLCLCVVAGAWTADRGLASEPAQDRQNRAALQNAPATSKRLDLRTPKITGLFSPATIDRLLRTTSDPDTIEEVEVEGRRLQLQVTPNTPTIPGGILAPLWALAHPTQAWRILLPLPPDQTATIDDTPPDATDPYRPPVLPPS